MDFEWHEAKRLANRSKHHLDFEDAWLIFEGPFMVEEARVMAGERRQRATGLLEDVFVTLVFVMRGDVVRCISLRRARDDERERHQTLFPG